MLGPFNCAQGTVDFDGLQVCTGRSSYGPDNGNYDIVLEQDASLRIGAGVSVGQSKTSVAPGWLALLFSLSSPVMRAYSTVPTTGASSAGGVTGASALESFATAYDSLTSAQQQKFDSVTPAQWQELSQL
jgi:hypothetical protein